MRGFRGTLDIRALTVMSAVPQRDTLLSFLRELKSGGRPSVRLSGAGKLDGCLSQIESEAARDPRIGELLREWHREMAEDMPGAALAFDEAAARWSAAMLFRAAWLYLHRDAPETEATALLTVPLPVPVTAASLFSADPALRWLSAVHRMALALAPGDPLLAVLQSIAAAHPLSCAALPPPESESREPAAAAWNALRAHPGLWRLFIDRVIAANARWWMHRAEVRAAVRAAAGAYEKELVPALDLSEPPAVSHDSAHS